MTIHFTFAHSPIGAVVVATHDGHLCSVLLGDEEADLTAALVAEYPDARLIRDDVGLQDLAARVSLAFAEGGNEFDLDLHGTDFQQRVWRELLTIPRGSTATYSEIAQRIGVPSAVRAVAGACAANRIAVLVPCHRVVRSDGGMGGYKWGVARKQALLDTESAVKSSPLS